MKYPILAPCILAVIIALLTGPAAYAGENAWHKQAMDKIHVVDIAGNPVQPNILYAVTSEGLMRSDNRGKDWTFIGQGLPNDIPASCVAINPHNSQQVFVGYDGKGLYCSNDGGKDWSSLNEGLPNLYVRDIVISEKDPNLIYLAIQNGVAISTNGGKAWHMSYGFKRGVNTNAIKIDPKNPQYMYAATGGAGIYKSGNGGVSWRDINDGLSSMSILDLHVDKDNPDILLAGAYHPATPTDLYVGEANGGVFRSEDGGRTWQETPLLNITIFSFDDDPQNPDTVYAGAWGGAYKSSDKGKTWTDINSGLDNAFLHKVHVLPGDKPEILGGTTYGLISFTDELAPKAAASGNIATSTWIAIIATIFILALLGLGIYKRKKAANGERNAW